ncbi:MAG: RNA polymerase sigma factor [Planctomycetota bacterium JB042]
MTADPPAHAAAADPDLVRLFQEHRPGLAGAVRGLLGGRAETQEILQEAFLRVWRARERGDLTGDPVGYAFVVTLNLARDHRRRRASSAADVPLQEVPEMALGAHGSSPTAGLERSEAVAAARAAIERLADDEKDVFFLRVSAGLTFDRVAETLDIPIGTAKTRMRAALARLRTRLAPHAPAPLGRDS